MSHYTIGIVMDRLLTDEGLRLRFGIDRIEALGVIERATIMCEDGSIRPEDLSLWSAPPTQVDSTDLEVIERRTIERVMREVEGNKAKASRQLGITRTQLYMRLRKYGIELS
jgi:transcriptional regulator of acetoin/glycerol metabolism